MVNLSVSRVVAVSPQMRLVEDNVSSLSLLDIYKVRCAKRQLEPDTPVTRYYERLASVQVNTLLKSGLTIGLQVYILLALIV